MSKRKTYDVKAAVTFVNYALRSGTASEDVRFGMILMLEEILHETGNYHGYRYLLADEVPTGYKPGVHYTDNGHGALVPHPDYIERFKDTDGTRREYFYS